MITRRQQLFAFAATAVSLAGGLYARRSPAAPGAEPPPPAAPQGNAWVLSDAQWRARLSPQQYAVLRQAATERAGSSPLNREHRKGGFACAGCGLPLFSSKTKFESGTGWPSFWQPLAQAVAERQDREFGMARTEVHCRRCQGHLGHVFDDGPKPTGLRYCMNGLALSFTPLAG